VSTGLALRQQTSHCTAYGEQRSSDLSFLQLQYASHFNMQKVI
jgi:hypothetical protein